MYKGKTHTMGLLEKVSENSEGIVPLSIMYLFDYFKSKDHEW